VGGQAGQHLLELGDVAGDDGEQVVHLAGDVVGGGDLGHGPDLVLEGAAGAQVVAGQARRHVHVQGEPGGGGVEPGADDADDAGLLEPADPVQRGGGGEPDHAGQLDVGAVRVPLQRAQQPDVNIVKINGHLAIDHCVVDDSRQILPRHGGTMGP